MYRPLLFFFMFLHSSDVIFSAGQVYKSTSVSQLNSNPNVSKEQLRRVRVRMASQDQEAAKDVVTSNEVGLYSDIALYIKDNGTKPEYMFARVQRMQLKGKSCVEYKQPIDLGDSEKHSKVEFVVSMYSRVIEEYRYSGTEHKTFSIWGIIRSVELQYCTFQRLVYTTYQKLTTMLLRNLLLPR